ncbi:MAG: gluconate 2-dehydrogenase subunit 3 family protein [Saprospiraceae bacterium]|nr:gluconate 2-dehydrogenase subunit 3 family protein [Saprospiraceae bacterium]
MENIVSRRNALKRTSYIIGGALSASTIAAVMAGCKPSSTSLDWTPEILAPDQAITVAEITERIIPKTDTPGAKDAMVDRYIDSFLKDIASDEERAEFYAGIDDVNGMAKDDFGKRFADLSDDDKDAVLAKLSGSSNIRKTDAEKAAELANEGEQVHTSDGESSKFFDMIRQLTITGFFTSEIGANQALVFDQIPGEWRGCIPYEEVGGAWAL